MGFFSELKRRNVVRVGLAYALIAWVLLQAADFGLDLVGSPNWILQSLFVLALIGLPAALVFAWVYEMTPEGLKREAEVDRSRSITPATGRRLDRVIIAFLAITVAFLVAGRYWPQDQNAAPARPVADAGNPEPSIAVLPFVNMSADPDNEYFSDGIAEELLNVLVRVSALQVASRTSSFAFKGREVPVSQIAKELGVSNIVEGSVRKAGDRVRITAQLIDAKTDRHLWSDTYDRKLDDIFAIQEEISDNIVSALKVALNVDESAAMEKLQRPTDNPEAYQLYLQGRYQWRLRGEQNIRNAIESFGQAIALDPSFAKAFEGLASAWIVLPAWSGTRIDEVRGHALEAANQALELDPALGEARAIRAHIHELDRKWQEMLDEFEQARKAEPRNATIAQWYAEALGDIGYTNRALEMALQAYRLDPASPVINSVLAYQYYETGQHEQAVRFTKRAIELGLDPGRTVLIAVQSFLALGDRSPIEQQASDSGAASELVRICIRSLLNPEDPVDRAALDAAKAESQGRDYGFCAATLNDTEIGLQFLGRAADYNPSMMRYAWDSGEPAARIRRSEGFKALLTKLGLVDMYRSEGWPDHCKPTSDGDFECH